MYRVFFSNRTECLLTRLKETLFAPPSTPFSRRMVIVPSPAMKAWLMFQLASDSDIGIAAGLEVVYLDQALKRLTNAFSPSDSATRKQLNPLELSLIIEHEIRNILQQKSVLPSSEIATWLPLFNYLNASENSLSLKGEKRLSALSGTLARLFIQYGIYGSKLAANWEAGKEGGWQQALWKKIFDNTSWSYSGRDIKNIIANDVHGHSKTCDMQIHLFAISYLPKLQHELLMHLNKNTPLTYYLLSPCQAFWSDLESDRQSHHLQAYWKKRGISTAQLNLLEEFLRDRNPLLANFGRIGREMAMQVEESQALTCEDYVIAEGALAYPQYEELITDDLLKLQTGNRLTLLQAIQADMSLLRTPDSRDKLEIHDPERTVQVHVASSKMREIQILYDSLVKIIHLHAKDEFPICPGDIIIMIPDIQAYIPYIKSVFESQESQLDAQIMDLPLPASSLLIQGFMHLLALPMGRWDAASVLQLLDYPHFQKRHQFKPAEIRQIRDWIKETGALWGLDTLHRDELLKRDHGGSGMVETSSIGTWEHTIERLLMGLAIIVSDDSEAHVNVPVLPLEALDATQGDLLGRWIELLRSLRIDLACLHDGTKLSLQDWSQYLHSLVDAYFSVEGDDEAQESSATLFESINAFAASESSLGNMFLPFSSIIHHLQESLNLQTSSYRENALHAVRFCALLPMRAIPAKVIAMVGMHSGAFPGQEAKSSLNLMSKDERADYCPTRVDYDRFLFLEAVLSARRYLLITYQGFSPGNGKEQAPSLAVTELLAYLDKSYTLDGNCPSASCVNKHPFLPFDKSYFSESSPLRSYSQNQYRMAEAYYHSVKVHAKPFIAEFSLDEPKKLKPEIYIDVRELASFAKDPLKAYYNKTLGIYLPKEEDRQIKIDENFQLTHLQNYQIKKDVFKKPVDEILHIAEKEGQLPIGAFKPVAIDAIQRDISALKKNISQLGVNVDEIFSIQSSDQYESPVSSPEGNWYVPALRLEYKGAKVKIVGQLSDISPQGMLASIKDDKIDIVKVWPQYLVFCCLAKQYELPVASHLLVVNGKTGKIKDVFFEDPHALLIDYLDYYFTALEHASPMIPEWIPHLLTKKTEDFVVHMQKSINNPFQPLYNDYVKWTMNGCESFSESLLSTNWKDRAQLVYSDMYRHWYPAKTKQEHDDGSV